MNSLYIEPNGAYLAALYFGALPLIIMLIIVWFMRLREDVDMWMIQRFGYWPLIVLFIAFYGVIWRWLFHDQFYTVTNNPDTGITLEYLMPKRKTIIQPQNVSKIISDDIISLTGGTTTTRIVIIMKDGQNYRSAQIARHREKSFLMALQTMVAPQAGDH